MLVTPTSMPAVRPAARPAPAQAPMDRVQPGCDDDHQAPNLARMLQACGRPYYDQARDQAAQARYYAGVDPDRMAPADLFYELSDLVCRTHEHKRGYDPGELLYRWVDLRPSLRLQSLYSPDPVQPGDAPHAHNPEELLLKVRQSGKGKPKFRLESQESQARQWAAMLAQGGVDAVGAATGLALLESRHFYNCEHVVPKHWFNDQTPMVGDLHHLFTCEKEANGERSSKRFGEVPAAAPALVTSQGKSSDELFEPAGGKGAIARATLYFLLRYPGKVGDHAGEYGPQDLKTLLEWNREYPVSLYERHRNQAICDVQGNRNPLIDHPEWADRIDFTRGLGHPWTLPARPVQPAPWAHDHSKLRR